MLVSRLGLVPDLDSFSRDADGALGVNFVFFREALGRGLGLRSLVARAWCAFRWFFDADNPFEFADLSDH